MKRSEIDQQIREAAEASLEVFITLVHPQRVLGNVHRDVINWWSRADAKSHQLLLLPRDHGKSAMVAYRVAWEITRNPAVRIMYLSSTANLAEKQLKFIKDILDSKIYRRYWPEMTHPDEGKREKWTNTEISVDHPKRKAEYIRDPTVFTGGLTTGITGMHCDISVFDDVVVNDNAYTQDMRDKVARQYSLLASIEGADARQWVVGTRYHPKDLYNTMIETKYEEYNDEGEVVGHIELYEKFEKAVEDQGDGTGQFLWPRQQRADGKWFGFDRSVLARKRSQYVDKTQFYCQYYNNPNTSENAPIDRESFQYYDRGFLRLVNNQWFFNGQRLNVFASVDFAYTITKRADYSTIAVVGVSGQHQYFILDLIRFKTDKISDYFKQILAAYQKWGFRKIRAEATAAQSIIVKDLKENYLRPNGIPLSIEEFRPTRVQGTKEERVYGILQPRYDNKQIWHYKDGNCSLLEEELILARPPHDDLKDALAACIEICIPPVRTSVTREENRPREMYTNSRFGGMGGR